MPTTASDALWGIFTDRKSPRVATPVHQTRSTASPSLPDEGALQLLFAELNLQHFHGEVPAYRISYNARFTNLAGRITYSPPKIELSRKHLERRPEILRETLLHEMIHAWVYKRNGEMGHGPAFKKKMREVGLRSIYHDLGSARNLSPDAKRYVLCCNHCASEVLRRRRPPPKTSCPRCSRGRYDRRFELRVFEITGLREMSS